VRRFFGRFRRGEMLVAGGAVIVLIGGALTLAPWYEAILWQNSPQAARAQRNADAAPPVWLTPGPPGASSARATLQPSGASGGAGTAAVAQGASAPPASQSVAQGVTPPPAQAARINQPGGGVEPDLAGASTATVPQVDATEVPTPTPVPRPSELQLASSAFQFLDPPEPGASARLSVSVYNPTNHPGGQINLVLPLSWLTGYRIDTLDPPPVNASQSSGQTDGALRLGFDGPDAGSTVDLSVDVVAIDEVVDAPALKVLDAEDREVGRAKPTTEAPPPKPGPIYSVDIPSLHLHAGVVPVEWEPPLFVVGQIRSSAFVTQGNSVLVGHVRGAAGYNVFDHLDQLNPGDAIVASSRGQTYDFVVSQKEVLPEDDTSPTDSTSAPRLTLMTCAGDWNPITRDYAERLWVIAEPSGSTAAALAPASTPTPVASGRVVPTQVSARGGLGNTDTDLASAFGSPIGESKAGLAVYRNTVGTNVERRAQLADVPAATTQPAPGAANRPAATAKRALLVANVPPADAPLTFEAAVRASRDLLPKDAQPRTAGPEGNQRFVVERFTSPDLAAALPAEWFADRQGQPGDLILVYGRRADGRIAFVAVGIGDDVDSLLSRFSDVRGLSP
jgi:LPXTG-site transpeptidase (sortase) family protein